ncbi:peptide ABC transporter substrate-binding protein [Alicyclobacillus fastidiosus]|nr:oligopeptide-binding protein OppA [Alicyclobacillus fastidiosus]
MKSRPMLLLAGVTTAVILAAAGCGNSTNTSSTSNSSNTSTATSSGQTPQKGGTLVVALPPQTNLTWYFPLENSQNASIYNAELFSQMFMPVLYIDNNYDIDYNDSLASNVSYNKAGTQYTITLNPKYKWSDGQPVTAQDVVWGYNIIAATDNPKAPAPWPNYNAGSGGVPANIQSVKATDDHTVVVTLKKAVNQQWFIYNGIGQLYAFPQHAWNKYPNNMTQEITYLGKEATDPTFFKVVDGAFKLQSAVNNQSWTMVPNDNFDGHKSTLDKLIFEYEGSSDSEFAALKTGSVNLGYLDLAQIGSENALKSQGDVITAGYRFAYFDTELNLQKGSPLYSAFNDLKVREALQMGVDQDAIVQDIYHGVAAPQYGAIPTKPSTKYLDPRLAKPMFPFNIDAGKKLLESDGWSLQNGVMTKNGVQLKFTLMYSSGSASTDQMEQLIQQDWKQMGVDVTLKPTPFATLIGIMDNPKDSSQWTAAGAQGVIYGGSYPTGEQLFEPGGLDNFGYDNPSIDKLIATTNQPAASAQQSQQDFYNYEYALSKDAPVIWNPNPGTLTVTAPNVHNATAQYLNPTTGYPLFQYVWMSK